VPQTAAAASCTLSLHDALPISGGVGDFAVQLARLAGARVTASARRQDQAPALRALGAHEVVVGDEIPPTDSTTRSCLGEGGISRSEEHTSELQSRRDLVCRLLL